jgi:hypothetical protein
MLKVLCTEAAHVPQVVQVMQDRMQKAIARLDGPDSSAGGKELIAVWFAMDASLKAVKDNATLLDSLSRMLSFLVEHYIPAAKLSSSDIEKLRRMVRTWRHFLPPQVYRSLVIR